MQNEGYIDTHVHFYDEMYNNSEEEVIKRALSAGVTKMIQPDIDSSERPKLFAISEKHPGVLYSMIGLYPGSVKEDWEEEIEKMLQYKDRDIVAIGEIGLDYHYSIDTAELQMKAFAAQVEIACELNLPVNIHLRDATEDFLKVLKECPRLPKSASLHAFSGSYETFCQVKSLIDDLYVGIGGVVTFKNAKVAESVKRIPIENIILETDAPYLAPVPHRGEINESAHIPLIAAKIAELKEISVEEVRLTTTSNAKRLFNL